MNKKGQKALEFLMTYGWAVLSAIIIVGSLGSYFYFQPQNQFKITIEECTKDIEFNFLFNMERLNERNITFEDFEYVTYLYMDDVEVDCSREGIEDCFVYGILKKCEDVEVQKIEYEPSSVTCFADSESYFDSNFTDCMVKDKIIEKYDLNIEWLNKNCECLYDCAKVNNECPGGCETECPNCKEYKCGNYTVEVLR